VTILPHPVAGRKGPGGVPAAPRGYPP